MNDPATSISAPRSPAPPDPRPIYIGEGGCAAFGMLHAPAGTPRGPAVLICPPFGNSDNGSYMPRRTWAQQLAAAGRPALRLDLPGTGDSPGGPGDPGAVESWIEAVSACATWLRSTYGLRTAVVGLGLGGLIASQAADREAPIDDLVLWAVPSRGRQFLRELKMFEAMLAARVYEASPEGHGDGPAAPPKVQSREDGSMESAGFALSAETVGTLRGIDLAMLTPGGGAGRRVLLLDRDGMELEERLTTALGDWGAEVETAPGPGFWQMMAAPYESVAPEAVIATVDAWLDRAPGTPATALPGATPPAQDEIRLCVEDVELAERPFTVDHASGRLLAIATEPTAGARTPDTLVLVNSGTLRRVGPNRMWVELARRWAARGVRTVRFDLSRESDLSPEVLGRFHPVHARPGDILWDHFAADFAQQYAAVIDHLRQRGHGGRFILVGISSGAYWSLNHLRDDDRVAAGVLINCSMLRWNELQSAQDDVAKLRSWATWQRLLRGEVPTERLLHAIRTTGRLFLRRPRVAPAAVELDEVDLLLNRLHSAGQRLTFVFGAGEPLRLQLEAGGRMQEVSGSPHVTVEYLDSSVAAHTLESVSLQRDAHALLDEGIEAALGDAWGAVEPAAGAPEPA
jgi:alpha-beta hydrolase superfamily lysophospholipase